MRIERRVRLQKNPLEPSQERDVTYQSAVRFCEKNPDAILEIMDEATLCHCDDVAIVVSSKFTRF